ncbi:MAG: choice-of-anchor D domain-containing protein [Myxococcales bacterium]
MLTLLALAASPACRCGGGPDVVEALPELALVEPEAREGDGRLLDFGRVRTGATYSRRVVVENRGRAGLEITGGSLLDASPELSLSAPSLPARVGPGERLHVTVAYAPIVSGSSSGRLVIDSNDPRLPRLVVQIRGAPDAPSLVVCVDDGKALRCVPDEPDLALEFGVVPPGSGPVQRHLVLRNVAPVELMITEASAVPPTSAEFRLLAPPPATLAAGAEARVPVAYEPVDGGVDEGLLEIRSDDPARPVARLVMKGGCAAPRLCPEPGRVDFGTRIAGGAGAERSVRLGSCGLTDLVISNVEIGPAEFAVVSLPPLPASIAPGDELTLLLRYAPQEPGRNEGALIVSSNDLATPRASLALHATAVAVAACDLEISPRSVQFGEVPLSGFSERLLFLSNIGDAPCRLSPIAPPSGSDSFTVLDRPAGESTLEPGGFLTLRVRYAPEGRKSERAALVVESDDPLEPLVEVELTGVATDARACDPMLVPAQLHFGIAAPGETLRGRLDLHNFGSSACLISEAGLTPGSSPAFSLAAAPELPTHLLPGASVSLEVAFSPAGGAQHLGTVQVRGGTAGGEVHEAQLAGLVAQPRLCLSPVLLDFGHGPGLRTRSFQISSCGSAPLELRGLLPSGRAFQLVAPPPLPILLAPGGNLDLAVGYESPTAEAAFGRVAVLTSDESQPQAGVLLRANAQGCLTRALRCSPTDVSFPATRVAEAATAAFVCASVGSEPVTIASIEVEPRAGFALDHRPLPLRLGVGERVAVHVELAPAEAGLYEANVLIASDDCESPRATVPLAGTALPASEIPCPASGPLAALLEWHWTQPAVAPDSTNVWMTPLVVRLDDDNGDGRIDHADAPDVVFVSHAKPADPTRPDPTPPGVLRALDGRTGAALWEVVSPALNAAAQLAAADLDGDGSVEIVGLLRADPTRASGGWRLSAPMGTCSGCRRASGGPETATAAL